MAIASDLGVRMLTSPCFNNGSKDAVWQLPSPFRGVRCPVLSRSGCLTSQVQLNKLETSPARFEKYSDGFTGPLARPVWIALLGPGRHQKCSK